MKKLGLLILTTLLITAANAQTAGVYSFGDSVRSHVGDAGLIDVDGNYVMMGRRSGAGNHYAKFGSNNVLQWSFTAPNSMAMQGWRMFQTANKDYIGIMATGFSAYIIRISENGTVVWNRTLGQITDMRDGFEDTNGDLYFLGGWGNREIAIRLDANGNEIWCKKITTGLSFHGGRAINPTTDGNIMLAGITLTQSTTTTQLSLTKLSKTGIMIWGYQYDTPALNFSVTDMEISAQDGSIMIAGFSDDATGPYDVNTTEAVVAKFDSAGNFVSLKTLGNSKEDRFTAITQIPSSTNAMFVLSGFSKTPAGATKLLLTSVDNGGNIVKYTTHGDNHGNGFFFDQINYDPTHGLNAMGTGSGFFVANASEYQFARFDTSLTLPCKSFVQSLTQQSFNLNRTGNFSNTIHTVTYDTTLATQVSDSLTAFNSCTGDTLLPTAVKNFYSANVSLYPNPVIENLTIDLGTETASMITITSISGRTVYQSTLSKARFEVATADWADGIYLVDIKLKNGQRAVKRVVVQ